MKYASLILGVMGLLTIFFVSTALSQQADSLVGYWSFDEGKGDTVKDQTKNANDGAIKGSVKWIDGKFGKAIEFAPGAYAEIPDSKSMKGMDSYTVAMWVKMNNLSADWNHLFERDGSYGITINSGGGDFRFTPNSGKVWAESKFKVKTGVWYYITMTADKNAVTFYVDGAKQADLKETIVYTDVSVTIGHGPSYPVDGAFDEVKFWATALTADEVKVAMKGDLAVMTPKEKLATTWAFVKTP